MAAAAPKRIAVVRADAALHAFLRASCDPIPGGGSLAGGLAYVGREFRTYDFMRVGEATAFYAALNQGRWSEARLAEDLALIGLQERFEIRRMKRAYRRALVLAYASASLPDITILEHGEEFDEPPTAALLERCVRRSPRAIVTYGAGAPSPALGDASDPYDARVDPSRFRALCAARPDLLRVANEAIAFS